MAIVTIEDYEGIIEELGVSKQTADKALAVAIGIAVRYYYNAFDCFVDMGLKTANIVFVMPRHRHFVEKFNLTKDVLVHDILPVTFKSS